MSPGISVRLKRLAKVLADRLTMLEVQVRVSSIARRSPPTRSPPLRVVRQTERVPTCACETGLPPLRWIPLAVAIHVLALAFVPLGAALDPSSPPLPLGCQVEKPVTIPAPVNLKQVLGDVYALEDNHQEKIFRWPDPTMEQKMADLFDLSAPKSKLEQFYTMLFLVSRYASYPGSEITFDAPRAVDLLLSSKVFSDPDFPRQIAKIHLTRKHPAHPRYQVVFKQSEVWLPLNRGMGFGVYREGMCQQAKALVFYGSFSFSLTMNKKNVAVYDFDNVDLWGSFGLRGLVNLDINYISIRSVEFLKGSTMGLVKAKVSRREFDTNQHSFLLKLIAKFVTDTSVQPIDW